MNKTARPKKPRTTATLTAEQGQLLRLMAERQKVSVSWLIRHAVDRLVEEESKGLQLPLDMPAQPEKKN
jgi:Ribbon-helix-helix protein, copG family